jgi:hypothetical protein
MPEFKQGSQCVKKRVTTASPTRQTEEALQDTGVTVSPASSPDAKLFQNWNGQRLWAPTQKLFSALKRIPEFQNKSTWGIMYHS